MKREYLKVTEYQRDVLLKKVLREGKKIKHVLIILYLNRRPKSLGLNMQLQKLFSPSTKKGK
jgi:hypothetical protein